MAETVNIPLLPGMAMRRRRSDTSAPRRKRALKAVGAEGGSEAHLPSRKPKVREAPGLSDSEGNHAPEKIR